MNWRWEKGSSGLKWPVQIYNLNFAFSSSADQKGFLIIKEFINLLLWWFFSHSKSNTGEGFLGWRKGMKEKVKEWFSFITIVMDKVYWLKIWLSAAIVYRTTGETGIWVELLRLNFTLLSLFLRIDSIFRPKCWGFSGNLYPITFCIYLH